MSRVLIVGAGLAALRTAEALRAFGCSDEIVVVGDEQYPPYNRPPLSKEALAGEPALEHVAFRQKASTEDVVWRLGESVVSADLAGRTVTLGGGEVLPWDALVAATGVRARVLPLAGGDSVRRHVVRTLDDALELRPLLTPGARVVILGAGFIGCEVAATATQLGCVVTCVALDPLPMLRPLGPEVATELLRRHEERGITFRLGVSVSAMAANGTAVDLQLSDGKSVVADVVVEAVGSVCAVGWLDGNGLDLSDGVLVDSTLRPLVDGSPIDGVAVVGDIARFPNTLFGAGSWRIEHWSLPSDTGRRAGAVLGAHLAGEGYTEVVAVPFEPIPSFWSDQFDVRLKSYGMPGLADPDGIRLLEGDLGDECVIGYHRGDDLMGVVGIGMVRVVNSYRDKVGLGRGD
jgi:NADPH-dependent 2,4-dienoyl-CoA reductase/sulfur reductase-like enzyme